MARGGFTEKEIEALKNHKYVVYVDNNKVVYSNEFKWIIWRFSTANPLTRYHKSERPVPSFQ